MSSRIDTLTQNHHLCRLETMSGGRPNLKCDEDVVPHNFSRDGYFGSTPRGWVGTGQNTPGALKIPNVFFLQNLKNAQPSILKIAQSRVRVSSDAPQRRWANKPQNRPVDDNPTYQEVSRFSSLRRRSDALRSRHSASFSSILFRRAVCPGESGARLQRRRMSLNM